MLRHLEYLICARDTTHFGVAFALSYMTRTRERHTRRAIGSHAVRTARLVKPLRHDATLCRYRRLVLATTMAWRTRRITKQTSFARA